MVYNTWQREAHGRREAEIQCAFAPVCRPDSMNRYSTYIYGDNAYGSMTFLKVAYN